MEGTEASVSGFKERIGGGSSQVEERSVFFFKNLREMNEYICG